MSISILKTLQRARQLIANPEHWTQGASARDRYGWSTSPKTVGAICFCSVGALQAVTSNLDVRENEAFHRACSFLDEAVEGSIVDFNDSHTHAEVLAAFDCAIEKAVAAR